MGFDRQFGNNNFGGNFGGGFGGKGYGKGRNDDNLGQNLQRIQWSQEKLVQVQKNFYVEAEHVVNMSADQVQAWRAQHGIQIMSGQALNPLCQFDDAQFPETIMQCIRQAGFAAPSPIQSQAFPVALSGCDMIGIAETGSGKTLSFLLPGAVHLKAQPPLNRGDGPIALVLAPTRELVQQIQKECDKFCRSSYIRSTALVGGMPKGPQISEMRSGKELVVATPGRLIDLMEMGIFNLKRTTFLCLDEADRMLDMGFEKPLRQICGQIRADRQTLFFSATWPKEVQRLANDLCKTHPVHIVIGSEDLKANHRVEQHVEVISHWDKQNRLLEIMEQIRTNTPQGKAVIFTKTKKDCDALAVSLQRQGQYVSWIHGDKSQWERESALQKFREGRNLILVATDVAARGLDIKDVVAVINYDMPMNIEDYVHRIGRTGRAGTYGASYTFFVKNDLQNAGKMAKELINIMREANQQVPNELFEISREHRGGNNKGKGFGGKGNSKGKGKGKGKQGSNYNNFGGDRNNKHSSNNFGEHNSTVEGSTVIRT